MKTKKTNIKYHFFYLMIVSSLLFLCGFMFLPQNNTYSETKWTEIISTQDVQNFLTLGSGTEASPYIISTPAQLATFSSLISSQNATYSAKYYKLTNNIDLSLYEWSPIGTASSLFKGNFDGNGYVISGLKINASSSVLYAGLFGYIDGATIKNLSINNGLVISSSTTSETYAGGFVARAANSTLNNLANLGVKVFSSATSTAYAGGIVGYTQTTVVSRTSNYSSVVSYVKNDTQGLKIYSYSGGIIGMSYGASSTVTYARNNGKIEAYANGNKEEIINVFGLQVPFYTPSAKPSVFAGGIIGEANVIISESFNSGEVTSGGEATFMVQSISNVNKLPDESYAGGIAGKSANTITNVFNTGNVTARAREIVSTKTKETQNSVYSYTSGEIDNSWYVVGYWRKYLSIGQNNTQTSTAYGGDIYTGLTQYKVTSAYAGGVVGYSTVSITKAYNDGQVSGGQSIKNIYIEQNIMISKQYTDYASLAKWSELNSLNYLIQIEYADTVFYSAINGNRAVTNTSVYGNDYFQNFSKTIRVVEYDEWYKLLKSGTAVTSSDGITYNPENNSLEDYIADVSFYFNIARSNQNALLTLYMNNTHYFRYKKNDLGWFTGGFDDITLRSYNYNGLQINQKTNYTVKTISSVLASSFDSRWAKNTDVNNGRPYLKDFYW